jgi:polar amino acid transport system substrate-binding protein
MKQVTQHNNSGEIRIERVPAPTLKAGFVLVQTHFSLISPGTERSSISARKSTLLEKAKRNPELVQKVLDQFKQFGILNTYRRVRARLDAASSLGYSAAGVVVAVGSGVPGLKPGDKVACGGGGYANHADFILVPKNLCVKVPDGVRLDDAAYTTLGAIALQGVRQADPAMGETVVVIGLGLVGQLTVQLLKANGCGVIGIDLDEKAVKLAKECGADVALGRKGDVKKVVHTYTQGIGADAVVITAATKSSDPVHLAGELCREKGRVVLVGDVGIQLPRAPYYMKELDFKLSRSYGPGRYDPSYEEQGTDYPVGYVRWTEHRNMQEFLRLLAAGKMHVQELTTHRFDVADARKAYGMISGRQTRSVGVLLQYDVSKPPKPAGETKIEFRPGVSSASPLNIGFVGAGKFAQGSLIPPVKAFDGATLVGACTGNGLSATNVAKSFGFQFATTAAEEVLESKNVGTVFIATRHNLHARYVLHALKAGKNVFVEKPLALYRRELEEIAKTFGAVSRRTSNSRKLSRSPILMVGFNRRFAPLVAEAKKFFENAVGPFAIQYRINAGFLPANHWTQDPVEGGGRIIGEVCHFVDLIQYFTGSPPTKVFAEAVRGDANSPNDDSVAVTLKFENGSVGVITYLSNGDSSVPKERIELFSTGRTAVIDNFQSLKLHQQGTTTEHRLSTTEKGHREEVRQFLAAVQTGGPSPIDFKSLVTTTEVTFKIVDSLKLGVPVSM